MDNFVIFLAYLTMEYISRGHYIIKLIKITIQYIIWAYTTDRHILIIGISLLQERWRWLCYSHRAKLCLSVYNVTFDYSTLKAHISKTANDRNKQISDSESKHLDGTTQLRRYSSCTNKIHVERMSRSTAYYIKSALIITKVVNRTFSLDCNGCESYRTCNQRSWMVSTTILVMLLLLLLWVFIGALVVYIWHNSIWCMLFDIQSWQPSSDT